MSGIYLGVRCSYNKNGTQEFNTGCMTPTVYPEIGSNRRLGIAAMEIPMR